MAVIVYDSFERSSEHPKWERAGAGGTSWENTPDKHYTNLRLKTPANFLDGATVQVAGQDYTVGIVAPAINDEAVRVVAYTQEQAMEAVGSTMTGMVCMRMPLDYLYEAGAPKGTYLADYRSPANVWLEEQGFWFVPLVLQGEAANHAASSV
jgi:hypothetical protein